MSVFDSPGNKTETKRKKLLTYGPIRNKSLGQVHLGIVSLKSQNKSKCWWWQFSRVWPKYHYCFSLFFFSLGAGDWTQGLLHPQHILYYRATTEPLHCSILADCSLLGTVQSSWNPYAGILHVLPYPTFFFSSLKALFHCLPAIAGIVKKSRAALTPLNMTCFYPFVGFWMIFFAFPVFWNFM